MPVVYVYGFPPRMELEEFQNEFFEDLDFQSSDVAKIDYKKEKIYAFIHTHNQQQAQTLIDKWNDKPMRKSGDNKLQVRIKTDGGNNQNKPQNNSFMRGGQNMGGNPRPRNNYNNNMNMGNMGGHRGPRPNFNQNNNFNQMNNYGNQNNQGGFNQNMGGNQFGGNNNFQNNRNNQNRDNNSPNLGPQKPVLYVYGFPKEMSQEAFEKCFLEGHEGAHKQTDFFQDKLYCFIHCTNNDTCDALIEKWDAQTLTGSDPAAKPLQVRYKGLDPKTMQILNNIAPVLWVYGYPKGTNEEQFKTEFLGDMEVDKIDFFESKLYAFVHCKDWKACMKLINKWEGKMMRDSQKSALQVRFKSIPNSNGGQRGGRDNNQGGGNNSFHAGGGSHGGHGGHGGNNHGGNMGHQNHNNNNFYGQNNHHNNHGGNNNNNHHQGGGNNHNGMGDMNHALNYNQTFGNQNQGFYNNNMGGNMGGGNRNNQGNMNFNNMGGNQMQQFNRGPQGGYNQMGGQQMQGFNMQQGGGRNNWNNNMGQMGQMPNNFGGNDGFRGKQQHYNNKGQHPQQFNQNNMNDQNNFRNPQIR